MQGSPSAQDAAGLLAAQVGTEQAAGPGQPGQAEAAWLERLGCVGVRNRKGRVAEQKAYSLPLSIDAALGEPNFLRLRGGFLASVLE